MPEIDGDRQHTMRAVPTGAGGSSPDVRQGALGGRRAYLGHADVTVQHLQPRRRHVEQLAGPRARKALPDRRARLGGRRPACGGADPSPGCLPSVS